MNPIIKKALDYLENANYSSYFEELDKISMPSIFKTPYATHKGKFIAGKYDWDFKQNLEVFAKQVDKYLSENFRQKSSILNHIEENTVLKLIEDDIEFVLSALNEVFEGTFDDNNEKYSKLKKQDFSNSTYRNQLDKFIKTNKKIIIEYFKSSKEDETEEAKAPTNKFDKEYELLRKLNFTTPLKYFKHLCTKTEKPLLSFIIRGNGKYGQEWLCHKLIHDYFENFNFFVKPLLIDFKEININTSETFLDELCKEFGITSYENKSVSRKKTMVKNQLLSKMETTSQILIFKNVCNSLIENFEDFYDILLFLSHEIEDCEHIDKKCIVLLIENEEHKLSDHEDKFIFLSKTPFHEAMIIITDEEEELKLIDLDFVSPITANCIKEWFIEIPLPLLKKINRSDTYLNQLISDCDNGHPDKVIPEVCKLININFEQKRELWLKF